MIRPANEGIDVWLCVEPVDFRKQITGLATLVPDALAMDPFSTQLFLFTNRRRTQCRILYWEKCGFVLWQKRLERARFAWPRRADAVPSSEESPATSLTPPMESWTVHRGTVENPTEQRTSQGVYVTIASTNAEDIQMYTSSIRTCSFDR